MKVRGTKGGAWRFYGMTVYMAQPTRIPLGFGHKLTKSSDNYIIRKVVYIKVSSFLNFFFSLIKIFFL